MAGYITRNANILLLFLILISALALVGATVYFQARFGAINKEYNAKLAQLQNVSVQLEQYQGILAKAREELQLKGSREEELTTKFTDIKTEKETLAAEREQLVDDKAKLQISLAEATQRNTLLQNTVAEREATIKGLNSDITELKNDITALNNDVDDLEDQVHCLQNTNDASEATCG